jgi:hypothetical protein
MRMNKKIVKEWSEVETHKGIYWESCAEREREKREVKAQE